MKQVAVMVGCAISVMGQPEVCFIGQTGLIDDDFTVTDEKRREFLPDFIRKCAHHVELNGRVDGSS
jgi:hypothetical protein